MNNTEIFLLVMLVSLTLLFVFILSHIIYNRDFDLGLVKSENERIIKYYSELKINDDKLSEQMIREMQSIQSDNAKLKEAIEYLESNIRRKDETIKEKDERIDKDYDELNKLMMKLILIEQSYDQLAVEYLTDLL